MAVARSGQPETSSDFPKPFLIGLAVAFVLLCAVLVGTYFALRDFLGGAAPQVSAPLIAQPERATAEPMVPVVPSPPGPEADYVAPWDTAEMEPTKLPIGYIPASDVAPPRPEANEPRLPDPVPPPDPATHKPPTYPRRKLGAGDADAQAR